MISPTKTYARVDRGVVLELLTTDDDITEMLNPAVVWIDVLRVTPEPQQGMDSCRSRLYATGGELARSCNGISSARA